MSVPMVPIGEVVEEVKSWNPAALPEPRPIRYIDLSSVDKDAKRVIQELVVDVLSNEAPSRARQLVAMDDVLVSTVRPILNGVALVDAQLDGATASTGYCVLRAAKTKLDPKYLRYWVQTPTFVDEMTRLATGASYPAVSDSIIKRSKIPLPPLPTQRRIAAVLDKAQALVANDRQTLALYDQLAKSLFLEMFGDPVRNEKGWDMVKLTDACAQITDGTHFSPPMVESGFPYVTAKHIKEYGLDFESAPTYVDQEHHEEIYRRCKPELGDVLYIKDGATTGIAAVNTMAQPFSLLSSVALFKPNKHRITGTYLCNWLNHEGVRERLIRTHMAGAAIKRFTLQKINQFEIPLPPLKQQQDYEKAIVRLSAQRAQAEQSLRQSESLFGSLLQGAFRGELGGLTTTAG